MLFVGCWREELNNMHLVIIYISTAMLINDTFRLSPGVFSRLLWEKWDNLQMEELVIGIQHAESFSVTPMTVWYGFLGCDQALGN